MNNKAAVIIAALSLAIAALAVASWHHTASVMHELHTRLVVGNLQSIAALLTEDQALTQELQREPFIEADCGMLESFLVKIRRDGVAKHADMKLRLDQLAQNNTAIVALLNIYAPQAQSAAFAAQSDRFRDYASAWRDRWNSVMELFMAGGNYPASGVSFPKDFATTVQEEITAAQ